MRRSMATTAEIDKVIGRHLREKRLKRGMTLISVSDKLGISYQQVQKYEQAASRISAATLFRIAVLYEVGVDKFFEDIYSACTDCSESTETSQDDEVSILIVESDPGDVAVTRRALQEFDGINILCVHDGMQALDVLKYKRLCPDFPKPSVVLSDVFIPKRDGLSVLQELKRDRGTRDIPVVFVTDNISPELISQAYQLGAAGYICRSFDFPAFKENIVDCIRYWTKAVSLPKQKVRGTHTKSGWR